jgi:hypothetical protein
VARVSRAPAGIVRRILAGILAALVVLLAPVSLLTGWAWSQVSDTDRFVATYGPLATSPEVRTLVGTRLTDEIAGRLGVVGRLPATRRVIADATDAVLTSDALDTAWRASLRLTHAQLNSLLAAEPGAVELNDGALQLQLGPFADAVKRRLVDAGVPFAGLIPEVNAAVTIVQLDADTVAQARLGYRLLGATASWLPWLALVAGVAIVLLWPTRKVGLIIAGSAAMLGAALLAVALLQGAAIVPELVPADIRPVASLSVRTALGAFASPALTVFVAGAAALFTGLMAKPERA